MRGSNVSGELVSIEQVADALGTTRQLVWNLRRDQAANFPTAYRIGKRAVRFRREEVERWLDSRAER